jgi:hypothetical protein
MASRQSSTKTSDLVTTLVCHKRQLKGGLIAAATGPRPSRVGDC